MGWRYRKSVKAGPFRLNFSKSGMGYSVGSKRYRVTKTANGTVRETVTLPGGLSHVTEHKIGSSAKNSARDRAGQAPKSASAARGRNPSTIASVRPGSSASASRSASGIPEFRNASTARVYSCWIASSIHASTCSVA